MFKNSYRRKQICNYYNYTKKNTKYRITGAGNSEQKRPEDNDYEKEARVDKIRIDVNS